jgi:hypothetical protein
MEFGVAMELITGYIPPNVYQIIGKCNGDSPIFEVT